MSSLLLRLLPRQSPPLPLLVRSCCSPRHWLSIRSPSLASADTTDSYFKADPKLATYFYSLSAQARQQIKHADVDADLDRYLRQNRDDLVESLRALFDELAAFVRDATGRAAPTAIADGKMVLVTSPLEGRLAQDQDVRRRITQQLLVFVQGELGFRDVAIVPSGLSFEVHIPCEPKPGTSTATASQTSEAT